jgi:hypothetical protein
MPIKTYRGFLGDEEQNHIRLKTMTGSTGYRIVKFELFPYKPGTASQESVVQIWTKEQTAFFTTVNFSDTDLLGAGYLLNHLTATDNPAYMDVVFDNTIFNQDIFITHADVKGSESVNYYLELEVVKLNDNENFFVTLADIKNALPVHGP